MLHMCNELPHTCDTALIGARDAKWRKHKKITKFADMTGMSEKETERYDGEVVGGVFGELLKACL